MSGNQVYHLLDTAPVLLDWQQISKCSAWEIVKLTNIKADSLSLPTLRDTILKQPFGSLSATRMIFESTPTLLLLLFLSLAMRAAFVNTKLSTLNSSPKHCLSSLSQQKFNPLISFNAKNQDFLRTATGCATSSMGQGLKLIQYNQEFKRTFANVQPETEGPKQKEEKRPSPSEKLRN